jgi:hypothetical protein
MKTSSNAYLTSYVGLAEPSGIVLPPKLWAVYAEVNGVLTVAEVAQKVGLPLEAAEVAFELLGERGLVAVHEVARDGSARRKQAVASAPAVAGPSPVVAAPAPVVAKITAATPSVQPRTTPVSTLPMPAVIKVSLRGSPTAPKTTRVSLRQTMTKPAAAIAPVVSIVAEGTATSAGGKNTRSGRWLLRPMLDAIISRASTPTAGKLLAYRVFLTIPDELLDAAGIDSINLIDDEFRFDDERLYEALVRGMRAVAGVEWAPEGEPQAA